MNVFKRVQRQSYLVSRTAGDLAAAQRGPRPYVRRRVRRAATRSLFRLLR